MLRLNGCAYHQGPLVTPGADGVSRSAKALLGKAFLGSWIFLHNVRQCD
mgnify:CR=1 FL=1